jgi:tRNA(adenine34) deaminase
MAFFSNDNDYYMQFAYKEAEKAYQAGEIPVGAVIVKDNSIIGRGYNQREMLKDPTAHAEMIAITSAAEHLKDWRLEGCTLYVTLEPCPMCAGAILNAKIPKLVFGAYDKDSGMCGSVDNLCDMNLLNHKTTVVGGILEDQCNSLLQSFFINMRQRKKFN